MTASIWGATGAQVVNVGGTIVPQSFVGTAGQTVFVLTAFTYTPGTNSIEVYINGSLQNSTRDYTETSTTSFTLVQGVIVGDFVDVIGLPLVTATATQLVATSLTGLSGTTVAANNLRGTATFAAATTKVVAFSTPEVDATYTVTHSGNAAGYCWITAKTINGFTLNCSASNSNSTDWHLIR